MEKQFNVFEEEIEECCSNPITGFFRDGFCHTDNLDQGLHVVCAYITDDFLEFSKSRGNDLSTPREEFNFPGLKEGDHWCVCAERWKEAYENDKAPKIFLRRTNRKSIKIIDLENQNLFLPTKLFLELFLPKLSGLLFFHDRSHLILLRECFSARYFLKN